MEYSQGDGAPLDGTRYHREAILHALDVWKRKQDLGALGDVFDDRRRALINPEIQQQLQSWDRQPRPRGLWIQGPHNTSSLSQNTLIAASLTALAEKRHVPYVFYFVDNKAFTLNSDSRPSHQKALFDMVFFLAVQFAWLLPTTFVTTLDLSTERLEKLQENALSVDDAMDFVCDLRSLAPLIMYCIIDGVQGLENREDIQVTRDLQNVLRRLTSMHSSERARRLPGITKLCFTTDGHVDVLAQLGEQGLLEKIEYGDIE
ncbi:MAG: hypothetical protein Q9219_003539 [cf. Caloplaca sp. 3 TL-2023]